MSELRTSIAWIKETLLRSGKEIHKSLGQHYLINANAVNNIARVASENSPKNFVVEIGSGLGVLTQALLEKNLFVTAVEIEKDSIKVLEDDFYASHPETFALVAKDFLQATPSELFNQAGSDLVLLAGNLPYQITSPILFRTAEDLLPYISGGLFMMQREVAERIKAPFGSRDYGILSVILQALFTVTSVQNLSPHSFYPPPKVDSQVLLLQKKSPLPFIRDYGNFKALVKSAFNQRRKKISTALNNSSLTDFDEARLKKMISQCSDLCDQRAEDLSWENYVTLSEAYLSDS